MHEPRLNHQLIVILHIFSNKMKTEGLVILAQLHKIATAEKLIDLGLLPHSRC